MPYLWCVLFRMSGNRSRWYGPAKVPAKSDWPWMCTMCQRCIYVCPMSIDIPQLVYNARGLRPREERPKGILGSCDMALRNESTSAMGTAPDDFVFVVEDVLEEYIKKIKK